jgi:hypothetical protein
MTFAQNLRLLAAVLAIACVSAGAVAEDAPRQKPAPGQFSVGDLPADRDGASLLTTPAPGRYAIRAKSASGARIELIDMIAGPGESSGSAGARDGRIDALLDKGVYKIRVFNAKGASGKVKLGAEPFVEVEAKRPTLAAGQMQSGELGDLQQRSYTLDVGASGRLGVEAVGRALQDMRLFSAGGEVVDLAVDKAMVEPKPGHFMTRVRLEGALAPGRYTLTAYGGEKLVWSDGAAAQPFVLRLDVPAPMSAGVAEGVIGPFGSARFEAPAEYDSFRLELPQAANARLEARRGAARQSATIGKNSREPVATLRLAADGKETARIEVSGYEGQAFSLRAVHRESRRSFEASGPHLVSLDIAGEGGDEAPATALLARIDKDGKTRVLASDLPRIAQGRAYRAKFNLRGTTSLLFETTGSGPIAIDAKGVRVRAGIEPALGSLAPRADGLDPMRYDLQAGFYLLTLTPQGDAVGVIDVTLGTPGLNADLAPAAPPRTVMSFGEQKLEKDGSYLILTNTAPTLLAGLRVVALPADLAKGPLPLRQSADAAIAIPVQTPKGGKIIARDAKGAEVPLTLADEKIENDLRFATVKIAAAGKPRALGLVYVAEEPKVEAESKTEDASKPPSPRAPLVATPAKPAFFDLARDETREVRFTIAQGGLYRVETLGRLRTAVKIGSAFSPGLAEGADNGPGHNGLVTTYLRAGAYRAAVTAKESSGRLGLAATPATLTPTPKLIGQGITQATLDAGKGAVVPIDIARDGLYRIELLGVARDWRARLDDADGWPLTTPGALTRLTRRFDKGAYRLVVMPEDVEARMVARLTPIVTPPELAGHGPHVLTFGKAQKLQWREPQASAAPRTPDVWRFSLHGDAEVELSISEGMIGEIFKGERESVGKSAGARKFSGKLAAGDYRVEARSLARDDRLDYEISLGSTELQPGAVRLIEPPATLAFSIARESIVDMTSFGNREMLGVVKDASGAAVERLQGRADDWNIALSRRLAAGAYTLELSELGAKPGDSGEETSEEASDEGDQPTDQAAAAEATEENEEEESPSGVEIRFALPAETNDGALAADGVRTLDGQGAHVLTLPAAPKGSLALVVAQSMSEVALSIERRERDGRWRVVGLTRGSAPAAAWPAGSDDKSEWRAVVWTVGGGAAPITIAARAVERRGRAPGDMTLESVEGLPAPVCVGLARLDSASLVEIAAPAMGLSVGSTPQQLLQETRAGPLAPQSQELWLMTRGDCKQTARVAALEWKGGEIALDIGAEERAQLPLLAPAPGKARLWLARSAFGRVGLDAGRGMAVADGATLALAWSEPLRVWNASGLGPLRLTLRAIDVEVIAPAQGGALYQGVIAPLSAQPVAMSAADAPLAFELAQGVAVFSAPDEAKKIAAFGDEASLARLQNDAGANIWLVNFSDKPAPARVALAPGKRATLARAYAIKRFFGASGQIAMPVEAENGDRLVVIGGDATFVSHSGQAMRGATIAPDGRGEAIVDYQPGLVALWLERAGKGPWPTPAPKALTAPQRVALEGAAMSLALKQAAPVVLDARSGAPAIVAFTQNGKRELAAFPSGVEFHHYMNAGEATLDIISPHDGALSGALDISTRPVVAAHEGVNDAITLGAGASALFTFETTRESEIGVGLRTEPDRASLRLFDASGRTLGEGVAQSHRLPPGRYFAEARAPVDAPLSVARLSILGLSPPPAGPPEEVAAEFLEKAGLKKTK